MPEFRLIINRQDDAYTARWVESGGQESDAFPLVPPLTAADTSDLRWYLETYYQFTGPGDIVRAQGIERKMEGWGRAMFDAVFGPGEAREVYRNLMDAEPRLLTIGATDPDILAQPWEMMRDRRGPLAFQGVTIRRQLQGSGKTRRYDLGLPLRVLLIVSRPADAGFIDPRNSIAPLLDAIQTLEVLQSTPERSGVGETSRVSVDFCDPPTLPRLEEMISAARQAKQPYHIVHFDGHGAYLPLTGVGALAFEDDEAKAHLVPGRDLGDMLSRLDVPLVILEACRSSSLSDRPVFGSVAPALLQSGVGSVVAFSHSVHVEAARILVERFYRELCKGLTVGHALEEARSALHANRKRWLRLGPDAPTVDLQDWFIPQLYQVGSDPVLVSGQAMSDRRPQTVDRRSTLHAQLSTFPPPPMYHFHGRAMELLELERAFRRHAAIVVTGMGGMGKTALSREAAAWWLRTGRFEAAVFCSFEFRAGAERAVQLLGQALEGDQFSSRTAQDQWQTAVRLFHEKRVLVVWDNWESTLAQFQTEDGRPQTTDSGQQNLRADLDRLYRDLTMPPAQAGKLPAGRLLVTCRPAETGLPRIKEMPLGGLARPDGLYLLRAVLDLKGISTDRKGYERAEMDRLLDALSDHPLSIELVAPHLRQLTPAEILRDYAQLLERFADEAAYEGRNKSLLASLEFSRQRLSQPAQDVLPHLAWFEGGVFEQFLLAFADLKPETWLPIRDELVATALIQVEELPGFKTSYIRFHPTLPYAARNAQTSEVLPSTPEAKRSGAETSEVLEQRFISVYLAVRQAAHNALRGQQPAAGMALVAREEANLRAAMTRAFTRGDGQQGWQIADTLRIYLESAGRLRERDALTAWAREHIPTAPAGKLDEAACATIRQHALTLCTQGKAGEAIAQVRDLIARLESEGLAGGDDPIYQIATSYGYLGRIYVNADRPDLALAPARKAIEMFERLPSDSAARGNLAVALGDLANAYSALGQSDAALQAAERALAIDRDLKHDREIATDLTRIAAILTRQQHYAEADACYAEALQAARAAGDLELQGLVLQHQGILQYEQGHHDRAVELSKQAIALFQRAANTGEEMRTCNLLASAEMLRGQLDAAEAWYARVREMAIQLNDRAQLAANAQNVGILYQTRAEQAADPRTRDALLQKAVASVQESLAIRLELQNPAFTAESYSQLGLLYQMVGALDQAEENSLHALQTYESLNLPDVYKVYGNLANTARARGDEEAAAGWQAKHDTKLAELKKLRQGDKETRRQGEEELSKFILALAQAVYQARGSGRRLPPEVAEALAQLEQQAPPPLCAIAPFLRAVAGGESVPPIPPGLPPQVDEVLRELVKAVAKLDAGEPDTDKGEGGNDGDAAQAMERLIALVVAGCRGDGSAGQQAYDLALNLQRQPPTRPLGKALQRLLEGLRGEDVLAGLPQELASVVEAIEAQL